MYGVFDLIHDLRVDCKYLVKKRLNDLCLSRIDDKEKSILIPNVKKAVEFFCNDIFENMIGYYKNDKRTAKERVKLFRDCLYVNILFELLLKNEMAVNLLYIGYDLEPYGVLKESLNDALISVNYLSGETQVIVTRNSVNIDGVLYVCGNKNGVSR